MAPTKYSNKTNEELDKIVKDITKAINTLTKEQWDKKDVTEVKVEVFQVGHGARPFGNHFPNDYIDFTIQVGNAYKVSSLGRRDIEKIGTYLSTIKGFNAIEEKGLFFTYGNFTPDMEFPTFFRKWKTPCKEFKKLASIVKKKYCIELTPLTLYEYGYYKAYDSSSCSDYIELIKSFGRKKTTCEVVKDIYESSLKIKAA